MVRNHEKPEILLYLRAKELAYHSPMAADRRLLGQSQRTAYHCNSSTGMSALAQFPQLQQSNKKGLR